MSTYWRRLLFFGFLLGAIPVFLIGLLSYYIAAGDIEAKVEEGNRQILHQTQMRVEQVLKTLELSAIQYVNSAVVTASVHQELTPKQFDTVRDLSKGLYHLQTLTGISEAYLINLEKDWLLSYRLFTKLSTHSEKEKLLSYADAPTSLFWETLQDDSTEPDRRTIRMVLKIPTVPLTGSPREMLIVDLLNSEVKQLIANREKLGVHYILDKNGDNILSESGSDQLEAIQSAIIERAGQEQEGSFRTTAGGKDMSVTYLVSPYNDWTYVSVVSRDDITFESRKIAVITWIVCLLIFVLIWVVAFFGSRRMYSPVRRLLEYSKRMEGSGLGTVLKDEFTFIEERLRRLSVRGKELQDQVKGQYAQLKEFFLMKLLSGQVSEQDFVERSQVYGFPVHWHRLAVLTLQIDTLQDTRYREHDRELLLFAVNNMVGELLPPASRFNPIVLEQSQVTIMVSNTTDEIRLKEELHRAAEEIKSKVSEFLQLKVSIGISHPYEKITGSMKAYRESLQALKCRLSLGDDIIIHFQDIIAQQDVNAATFNQMKLHEDQLVESLKTGEPVRVKMGFEQYIALIVSKEISFADYSPLMVQLIAKVYQLVQEQGGSIPKVLGPKASLESFMKLTTLHEITVWFEQDLLGPVARYLNEQSETQYHDIANRMVKLIHEKYAEDFSLEACAAQLNFHPVYLSRVFKKETGVNFSDYLAEHRMSIAKQWLEKTNDKIADIADRLRYTNTSAFIRTFRRIVGMTPGQYREQFRRG
ncbi:helix-turn-helix domain-containing protein [Paenibacillus sp. GD4]|uniref:helix-turn-helix domain-containing protein n=1 Tax=Paenibacillus sp. GD4 TaxID=3068890 RepID=UPI002796476F|nr:helix-turn-helix domain-containing protein [Paenibacillus sp. GD4]MDQ1909944.1 helix-turn-helix domain-containing protein [Paenibacillus sp. GD4]